MIKHVRETFVLLCWTASNNLFLDKTVFSDEATFHLSRKVNLHNLFIWAIKNPRQVVEHVRDSPKVSVM
jgi:hypothetical protein